MTDNQRRAAEVASASVHRGGKTLEINIAKALDFAEARGYERGRAEVAARIEALAAAQEASSARWTVAIGEADNDTDRGYFSGRAHASEQAAVRLHVLVGEVKPL